MNTSRVCGRLGGLAAIGAAIFLSGAGYAADLSAPDGLKDTPGLAGDAPQGGDVHATIPAGVTGAAMVGQGEGMAMYMPMYMNVQGNYIGVNKVSTATILNTLNESGGGPKYLRMVPEDMDGQMHMFGAMYGVTNAINIMVMGNYTEKDMSMSTYYKSPMQGISPLVGTRTYTTDGLGDVSVTGLFRIYEDGVNHIHVNLGLSLPTGSTTEQMNMLTPMSLTPSYMLMRATYGMQLGTGTYDLLPGLTYTAIKDLWSWGAAYRGRIALDSDQGYHWGDVHQVTGWLGYTFIPGVTATARIAGTVQGKIDGKDPEIFGGMQGANPANYGGETIDLFGGIEIAGHEFGLGNTRLAIEAGAPLYQNLNGPQIGENWQLNAVLAVRF
ncbi:MAG: alpha-amylase [Rhodomicrobium sp.]